MTIVEFTSADSRLTRPEWLAPGIQLYSPPVGDEQTVCEFKTIQELTVYPMCMTGIEWISQKSGQALRLSFKLNEGVLPSDFACERVSFFINATPALASHWHYFLTRKIECITAASSDGEQQRLGGQELLTSLSLDGPKYDSIHGHVNPFQGLCDFFHFPERFLFVNLNLSGFALKAPGFTITIDLNDDLSDFRVHPELFKLHCVPAINLFSMQSEPIIYKKSQIDYTLVMSQGQSASKKLSAIEQIKGIEKNGSGVVEFKDFHQTIHPNQDNCYYRISQVQQTNDITDNRLIFSGNLQNDMYVSCDVLANNGQYPRQHLAINSLYIKDCRVSLQLQATNISRPGRCYHPVFEENYAALVLSTLNADINKLAQLNFFKQLLRLHDWSVCREALIDAVSEITLQSFNRLKRGVFQRGVEFCLSIKGGDAISPGEINVFGDVIYLLIRTLSPLNTIVNLTIMILPSEQILSWSVDDCKSR